ncbi:Zinc-finger of the MIZ type in Nse subunit [Rhizoctonia solani]|uniref:Zinc-finger of the MIZ type in Nse subunit n=1 Tax=Rhizoctonia solani TaxID=456999 RepID=A0A8H7H470_9AGAM|nr:Zinc-finger of the MIZ type in Nse subunit [Rhizoctonia solani]
MSRRVKVEKGLRGSQRAQAEDDVSMAGSQRANEDDEAAKLERVLATIANYPDQPLDEQQETKLGVISSEISVFNALYSTAIEDLLETATMLADALPGDDHPFENEVDPASILDAGFEKRIETYRSQTSRQKYGKSQSLKGFISDVWETYRPEESAPTVNSILPREEGDPEESDDEMEVGGVTQDYKCPLTLQIYDDPLTSTVCGHSFSADAIRTYVRTNNRCPAQGCNAQISSAVLKEDKVLQKKARAAKRRAAREETASADEIDD